MHPIDGVQSSMIVNLMESGGAWTTRGMTPCSTRVLTILGTLLRSDGKDVEYQDFVVKSGNMSKPAQSACSHSHNGSDTVCHSQDMSGTVIPSSTDIYLAVWPSCIHILKPFSRTASTPAEYIENYMVPVTLSLDLT